MLDNTALHLAARFGQFEVVKYLATEISLQQKNNDGKKTYILKSYNVLYMIHCTAEVVTSPSPKIKFSMSF